MPADRAAVEAVEASPAAALLVCVEDSGVGIPPQELESIFDKFVQSTRSNAGGTGLGLAICREITAAHGGAIWAENRAGGGAAFHVVLPCHARATSLLAAVAMSEEEDA